MSLSMPTLPSQLPSQASRIQRSRRTLGLIWEASCSALIKCPDFEQVPTYQLARGAMLYKAIQQNTERIEGLQDVGDRQAAFCSGNCHIIPMDSLQIRRLCTELSEVVRTVEALEIFSTNTTHGLDADAEERASVSHRLSTIHRNVRGIVARLQDVGTRPDQFLYHLATQNQILACVKWLSDHQVVACLPLMESIAVEELASLADVDVSMLSRVVRLVATVGYLQEDKPGHVAHTPLSIHFTTELPSLDAITLLASDIAPLALRLTSMTGSQTRAKRTDSGSWTQTQPLGNSEPSSSLALKGNPDRPQIRRQWAAYCQNMGLAESILGVIISNLNWRGLGQASVVHICAMRSELADALAKLAPALRVTVQIYEWTPPEAIIANSTPRLPQGVLRRASNPQPVRDAAVYIVQPDASLLSSGISSLSQLITSELRSHLPVLRGNPSALLILAPPLLPEPGSVTPQVELQARVRDFAQLQLSQDSALELSELYGIVQSLGDNNGMLTVCNEMRSQEGHVVALAVKYQLHTDTVSLNSNGDLDLSWGGWSYS